MFAAVHQPGVGEVLAPGIPLDFSALPRQPAQAAPQLGEDTEQVLAELIGIDQTGYGRLIEKLLVPWPRPP